MKADFEETTNNQSPVFATFAYHLLEEILASAGNPTLISRQLVAQLRELTGARLVVLTRQRERERSHQLEAVEPQRRRSLAESPAMLALANRTRDLTGPTLWQKGNAPTQAQTLLEEDLPGPAVVAPLRVGEEQVGALLLFGLSHEHNLDQVIDMLGALARATALVLRNAAPYEDQEAAIAARTRKLRQSEERLEVTLRSIGDAVISTDIQGKVTLLNPVAEGLTGWDEAEALGKPLAKVFRIVNEQTRQPVEDPVARVLRQGAVVGLANHTLLIARDGNEIPIADSGAPIRDAQGEISGVVLVFRDQSEERAAQEALRQSEQRFRSLFDQASVSIWEEDFSALKQALDDLQAQGVTDFSAYLDAHPEFVEQAAAMVKVLHVNEEAVRMFEAESKEDLLGALPKTFLPDSWATFGTELLAIARGEERFEQLTTGQTLRGKPLHILLRWTVLEGHPRPHRVLVSMMDITARKRAEDALRESEEKYRGVFDESVAAIYLFDAQKNFIDSNQAGLDLLGYAREELLKMSISQVDVEPDLVLPTHRQLLAGDRIVNFEHKLKRKDGSIITVLNNSRPITAVDGSVVGMQSTLVDVSARKRTEATWQALNTAAVALQRAAPRAAEIYQAASEQITALGLRCVVFTFDEATDSFVLKHFFLRAGLIPTIEKLTGLTTAGFQFPRRRLAVYARAVESKEAVFVGDSFAQIVLKLLPQSLGRLAGRLKKLLGLASSILAPLQVEGRVVGVLQVGADWLSAADMPAITAFADQMSAALENARLFQAERQRAQETAALLATAQAIASLRLDEVLETIASQARALFKADGSRIHLLEPDGETLRCVVALHERAEAALATLLKVGEGITGRVALQGAPEIVNQALADPDMLHMPGTPVEAEALALAPLQARGQVIGVMTVTRLGEERPFAPADLTFLTAFANQAAIAIDNARLHEETQRLAAFNQDIVQSMAEGIVVQDADGICTFANPTAATMLGYAPDELVGLHWTAITPPDQQSIIQRADERRRRGESDRYELELVGKDGKRIVALMSGVPRFDRQGQFVGTMGVFTDITERKRAAEILKASESKYRALFEGIDDAIFVHPFVQEGFLNFIEVNEVACRRLGYSREELLHLSAADISAPEDVLLRGSREGKEPLLKDQRMVFEALHLTKSGQRIPVEISSRRFELEGQPVIMSLARDISQRKQAEQVLRQSEEKFRSLVVQSSDGIVLLDETGVIVEWNPAQEGITGIDRTQAVGQAVWDVQYRMMPDEKKSKARRAAFQAAFQQFYATGQMLRLQQIHEAKIQRSDGTFRTIEQVAFPILTDKGFMLGTIVRDVTERKQAEERIAHLHDEIRQHAAVLEERVAERTTALQARVAQVEQLNQSMRNILQDVQAANRRAESYAHDLERANVELTSFSYSVSHDLRAPLRGIDGWSLALLEDYGDQLDEQAHEYLARVRAETQRMGQLIDDLLSLSRVGRVEMRRETVDLSALAQEIAARLQKDEPGRQVEFVIQAGVTTRGDPHLLGIALTNLLSNAWKFSGPRSPARIEFGRGEIEGQPVYFVGDNGVGFDMAYASKLFGAFQRLHSSAEFAGTGIGLATVQRIVHRHGGRVWAEAEVDRGATFHFTLQEEA